MPPKLAADTSAVRFFSSLFHHTFARAQQVGWGYGSCASAPGSKWPHKTPQPGSAVRRAGTPGTEICPRLSNGSRCKQAQGLPQLACCVWLTVPMDLPCAVK